MPAFVDNSVPLRSGIAADRPGMGPRIEYLGHHDTVADMLGMFPGAGPEDLPDGAGWAIEKIWLWEIGYCHIEKLYNLEALPSTGFRISCFPHRIHAASAGWTRTVAIVADPEENS
jgi:hypothetical protein